MRLTSEARREGVPVRSIKKQGDQMYYRRNMIIAVSSSLSAVAYGSAFAQAVSGLEEVVVTARKTEESVQVVPVSVTALSSDMLTRAAVLDVQDLRSSVPGLFVATNSQGGAPTFAIRAAKADNGTSDTVTAYIGDVPVASTRAIANMVYDMQSISVLKGPQGTLFGANSTGGAIIFRPNTPTNKFEGYAEVGAGNFDRKSFQGMINVPINDALQFRLAGEVVDRDKGYQKNHTPTNGNSEMGTDKHQSARLGISLKPTDAWENNFIFDFFHENDQPYQDIPVALRPRYNYTTFLNGLQVPVDYALAGGTIAGDPRNVTLGGGPTWNKANIWDGVYTTQYEFNNEVSIKNVLGYQNIRLDTFQDNDSTRFAGVNQRTQHTIKQLTVEPSVDFKFADGRFRNKTGLFYSHRTQDTGNSSTVVGLPWDFTAFGPVPNAVSALIPNFYPIQTSSFYNRDFKSRAIYTQFSYDLSNELTATLGVRYTWDKGDYGATYKNSFGTAGAINQGKFFATGGSCSANLAFYSNFDPAACHATSSLESSAPSFTFSLENRFSDASMAYATIRGGYLVGGFNNNINPATGVPIVFNPEKVTDFETGLKSDWDIYGHPIRTNLAVFYGSYKDQQRVQNGTTAQGQTFIGVVNAGSSTFYGLDLDVTYEITNHLEVRAGWNHIHSEYTKFDAIVNIPGKNAFVDLTGEPMSQTPEDVVNAAVTLKWPLPSTIGNVSSTLGYFWSAETTHHDSPTINCNTNPPTGGECVSVVPGQDFRQYDKLPSYSLWNFTTGWKNILQSSFDLDVWVKNLTDKEYVTYGSNQMLP